MLSLLDLLLFRGPEHVEAPEGVRRIYFRESFPGIGRVASAITSYPLFRDLQRARPFAAAGAFFPTEVSVGRGEETWKAPAVLVTPSYLRLLGVRTLEGRLLLPEEGEPASSGSVVIVSEELAHRAFGGVDHLLGRSIAIGGASYTVVGAVPSRFTGVDLGRVDLWLPMSAARALLDRHWSEKRGSRFVRIVVRLRPGVGVKTAEAEATALYRAVERAAFGRATSGDVVLGPIQEARGPEGTTAAPVAEWLSALSLVVLLIACANVAAQLLGRGVERRAEIGVRLALGASRGRLVYLAFCEALAVALMGGAAGITVASLAGAWLRRAVLPESPPFPALAPRSLALGLALTAVAGLAAAVAPVLWHIRRDPIEAARAGASASGRAWRAQGTIAASQLALTFVLVAGAGAFAWSLWNALHADLGFDAGRVFWVSLPKDTAHPPAWAQAAFERGLERVRRLPGVERASLAATVPFAFSAAIDLEVPGVEKLPVLPSGGPYLNAVSPDFFATLGTRVKEGRPFASEEDRAGGRPVAIVNETMARLLWPGREALGRCLKIGESQAPCATIVGVVEDSRRQAIAEGPTMQCYVPLSQAPKSFHWRALFAREGKGARHLERQIRREFRAATPGLPLPDVDRLSNLLEPELQPWRTGARVLALFGGLAFVLSLAGVYGVVAAALGRRRYELGVRLAHGAPWRRILGLSLAHGLRIGVAGGVFGLALTLAAAKRLEPLLYRTSVRSPSLLGTTAAVVLGVALLASYLPARSLRHLDLTRVLRAE
jgi:predicted permease